MRASTPGDVCNLLFFSSVEMVVNANHEKPWFEFHNQWEARLRLIVDLGQGRTCDCTRNDEPAI